MASQGSVQRTFRLSRSNSDLLDAAVRRSTETRNSLADRLIGEGLRTESHPAIRFRTGAAGRREPVVAGTRLLVRQVVSTVRAANGDSDEAADVLSLSVPLVKAALSYYAEFSDEVDDDQRWADDLERVERERWEREQALFA